MTGVRPLGGKYEDFWTSQVGIPKWETQDYPVRFQNIYYGRTLDFQPDDFGTFLLQLRSFFDWQLYVWMCVVRGSNGNQHRLVLWELSSYPSPLSVLFFFYFSSSSPRLLSGALRQAIMTKVGMTEHHCRALPDVLVMNRGTIGGQGILGFLAWA